MIVNKHQTIFSGYARKEIKWRKEHRHVFKKGLPCKHREGSGKL